MKDQDPSLNHLSRVCEQNIYDTYRQQQPGLVKHIELLIRKGQSPTDIESFVRNVAPSNSQVPDHVYLIACHLLRGQFSQN